MADIYFSSVRHRSFGMIVMEYKGEINKFMWGK